MISLIVARSKNKVIGVGEDIPWRSMTDLLRFKRLTQGKKLVVGSKTFETLPKTVQEDQSRHWYILSRSKQGSGDNFNYISFEELEKLFSKYEDSTEELMVAGGGQIYKLSLPFIHRMYLSEIDILIDERSTDIVKFPFKIRENIHKIIYKEIYIPAKDKKEPAHNFFVINLSN